MRTIVIASILIATAADAKPRHARVAQSERESDEDEGDGPEAKAALPIKLDDLIEVAVRLAPDLARAKIDRVAANLDAEGARRDQAWVASTNLEAKRSAVAENVEAPPFAVVAQSSIAGGVGLGRNLPTGGNLQLEAGVQNQTI